MYVACSAADVAPMLAEQAAVEKKMETLQVAAPEEPTVSGPEAVGSESVPKVRLQSKTQRWAVVTQQLCSALHPRYCLAVQERRNVQIACWLSNHCFPIQAQKNPLFKLRFKGLGDQKKSKAGGMPSVGSLQGDDSALPSSELILK